MKSVEWYRAKCRWDIGRGESKRFTQDDLQRGGWKKDTSLTKLTESSSRED